MAATRCLGGALTPSSPLPPLFQEEERVLELWEKLDAFKQQLKRTEGMPE